MRVNILLLPGFTPTSYLLSPISFELRKEPASMALNAPLNRKLRMGLVGGGQGSFIGRVHSMAAILDHRASLVAGALAADPAKARASASDYGIAPERAYGSYQEMVEAEKKLPRGERI